VKKMEKKRIAFELSETLYKQIEIYAQERQTSISSAARLALIEFVATHNIQLPTAEPEKPKEEVGPDGWTASQRRAIRAEAEARRNQTTERPRELSPTQPIAPPIKNPPSRTIEEVLADWST
jgi:hypothetical protein